MKQLLLIFACAVLTLHAQYGPSVSGSATAAAEINSKPAIQSGLGPPTGLNCTVGKDFYVDKTGRILWICSVTGTPGTWQLSTGQPVYTTFEAFGAVGDNSTDDTTAMNAAIAFVNSVTGGNATVLVAAKTYKFSFLTPLTTGSSMVGQGMRTSILNSTDTTHTLLPITGSGANCASGAAFFTRILNLGIRRTTIAASGNGVAVVDGCWVLIDNVESQDSISNFYLNGSANTYINRASAGWQTGDATARNGLELDSSNGTANDSTYVKLFVVGNNGSNRTGVNVHGGAVNDTYLDDIQTAGLANGIVITSTSSGALGTASDIHITNAVLDGCLTKCLSINNVYGPYNGVSVIGGFITMFSGSGQIGVDLESTQNVQISGMHIAAQVSGTIGLKIAGANSMSNQIRGNAFLMAVTALSVATPWNVISGNTFNAPSTIPATTYMAFLSGATNNVIEDNSLNGYATTGVSFASGANSNTYQLNQINPANIGTPLTDGGTANSTLTLFRCATPGATLPAGSLTTVAGACGSTTDTGLKAQ